MLLPSTEHCKQAGLAVEYLRRFVEFDSPFSLHFPRSVADTALPAFAQRTAMVLPHASRYQMHLPSARARLYYPTGENLFLCTYSAAVAVVVRLLLCLICCEVACHDIRFHGMSRRVVARRRRPPVGYLAGGKRKTHARCLTNPLPFSRSSSPSSSTTVQPTTVSPFAIWDYGSSPYRPKPMVMLIISSIIRATNLRRMRLRSCHLIVVEIENNVTSHVHRSFSTFCD